MAEDIKVKYLSYDGLKTYNEQIKKYYSNKGEGAPVDNAKKAVQLSTSRTITLEGDVTGSYSFDGSGNVNFTTTIDATKTYTFSISGNAATATSATSADNATLAEKATNDVDGNAIKATYATYTYVDSKVEGAIHYKGSVQTYNDLLAITDKQNGDVYNVVNDPDPTKNNNYIWSSKDNQWSIFGAYFGPATSDNLGLVKIGSNITNESGKISIIQSNVDGALGYTAPKTIKLNGTEVVQDTNRVVNIDLTADYYSKTEVATLISNLQTWVNTQISNAFQTASDEGRIDDIRTYATYNAFPAKGVEGVQYVAADTKVEYQWKVDDVVTGAGHYEQINDITTKQDIEDLFK